MKKKLLFVNISMVNGGAEKSLVNLLNELSPEKYHIDLLLFRNEGLFLRQIPEYVNLIEAPTALTKLFKPIHKSGRYAIVKLIGTVLSKIATSNEYASKFYRWNHFYKKLIQPIAQGYDVAIAYVVGEVTYFVDDLIEAKRKIAWVHTDYRSARCDSVCDREHYKNMDAIVTVSKKCAKILKEVFPESIGKIYNIPNITSSELLKNRAKEFYPNEYDENCFTILSIGRLVPLKGFDMAIRAAALLKKEGLIFKWYLIGDGECKRDFKRLISDYNISDVFFLLGAKYNPYPYIENADLIVQTSKYEGKSMVLDEAKILGVPIVATNYDTVYDQIVQGKEGMIVDMSEKAVAEGIKRMITDKSLRLSIKNYMNDKEYGNQKEIERYISIIEGLDYE